MQQTRVPEPLWHRGMLVEVVLDGTSTGGAFAVLDVRAARGAGVRRDLHEREDQGLLVLGGELEVVVGGEPHLLAAGRSLDLPRGVVHGFTAVSDETRFLLTCVPAGFETFVRATGTPAAPGATPDRPPVETADADDLAALRAVAGLRELSVRP